MFVRYSDFEQNLTKRKFHANYFLFGADPFLIDVAAKGLMRALEDAAQGQVVPVALDLDEVPVDELVNSAQSLSMFAPRQVLVVKGVMKLREHQGKRLAQYLSNPNPYTVVLFLAGDLDRDQRKKKIFEILSLGTQVIELAPLDGREVTQWLQRQAEALDCILEPEAIRFLLSLQGTDLGRLQQELEKAALYASGTGKQITVSTVEAVSGFAASHTLFEFLDAIVARKKVRALELIEEIFFTGKETGLAFWWFGQQLRQWLQFNELAGKLPATVIAKQVGASAPAAHRMQEQAKRFSQQSLVQAMQRLASVDDKVKSSSVDTRFTMELLVHDLTS